MNKFESICKELLLLIKEWEPKLSALGNDVITERRNSQNRKLQDTWWIRPLIIRIE